MKDQKDQYNWWKEEVLKKKIFENKSFLSQTLKNLNNGKMKFLDFIKEDTNYLPENTDTIERIYHLVYNFQGPANKCKYCGKGLTKFKSFYQGYQKYCSQECSSKDPDFWGKKRKTDEERYGGHHMKNDENKKKVSEALKKTFKDKDKKNDIVNRRKQTYFKRTGYRHQMHNPEVVNKLKETAEKTRSEKIEIEKIFS